MYVCTVIGYGASLSADMEPTHVLMFISTTCPVSATTQSQSPGIQYYPLINKVLSDLCLIV